MRGRGIEPRSTGHFKFIFTTNIWKPVILPLNYPRIKQNNHNAFLKFMTLFIMQFPMALRTQNITFLYFIQNSLHLNTISNEGTYCIFFSPRNSVMKLQPLLFSTTRTGNTFFIITKPNFYFAFLFILSLSLHLFHFRIIWSNIFFHFLTTRSTGVEPATSTLGGWHSIQAELRSHKIVSQKVYLMVSVKRF